MRSKRAEIANGKGLQCGCHRCFSQLGLSCSPPTGRRWAALARCRKDRGLWAASCLAICIQNGRLLPGTLLHFVEFCWVNDKSLAVWIEKVWDTGSKLCKGMVWRTADWLDQLSNVVGRSQCWPLSWFGLKKDPGRAVVRSACYKVGWKLLLFQLLGYPTDCKPGRSRFLDVQHNIIMYIYIYIYMMSIYIYI